VSTHTYGDFLSLNVLETYSRGFLLTRITFLTAHKLVCLMQVQFN
jgi:hypothetical protein